MLYEPVVRTGFIITCNTIVHLLITILRIRFTISNSYYVLWVIVTIICLVYINACFLGLFNFVRFKRIRFDFSWFVVNNVIVNFSYNNNIIFLIDGRFTRYCFSAILERQDSWFCCRTGALRLKGLSIFKLDKNM